MNINTKITNQAKRAIRVRSKINGTAVKPRLSVFRSNQHLHAQLIDDQAGKTLLSLSTAQIKIKGTKTEQAQNLGTQFAQKAKDQKITTAVFDRGQFRYHGRIKAFANSIREAGLKI